MLKSNQFHIREVIRNVLQMVKLTGNANTEQSIYQ